MRRGFVRFGFRISRDTVGKWEPCFPKTHPNTENPKPKTYKTSPS
jgi:hypothetical protein